MPRIPSPARFALLGAIVLASSAAAAMAAEARIDFGFVGGYQTKSTAGKVWNNVTNPLFGTTKLADYSTGSSTSWSLEITKAFNGTWDFDGTTAPTGNAATAFGATAAMKDAFTAFTSFGSPQLTLRNLSPTQTYNLGIFASDLGGTANRTAQYVARGASTVSGMLNAANNKSEMLTLTNVVPTAQGTITLDIGATSANSSAFRQVFLNALKITSSPIAPPPVPTAKPKNLLFFGNSFTQMYDVPNMVATFAVADGQLKPYVVGETADSRYLEDQILQVQNSPQNNVNKIAAGQNWDHVVIQEFSSGATHAGDPAAFRRDAATLFNLVKAKSANVKPVLYETWAYRPDSPRYSATPGPYDWTSAAEMQSEIRENYRLAKADLDALSGNGALLAGVGDKWEEAGFAADLYDGFDDKHPSARGAALNGLVLYATIYNEKVGDIPFAKVADWANQYGLTAGDWARLTTLVDGNAQLLSGASLRDLSMIAELALVPEPASMAALAGLLGVLARRRRVVA